jgi:2-polyprenyl-3-methyl-5-hydroxy-6-metoxy-1,4-benzoquinol methylase
MDKGTNLRYYAHDPAYREKYVVNVPSPDDNIRQFVKANIPPAKGDCIEIGCSPGGFLTLFGELGYTLHGIDFDPRIQTELPSWLRSKNFLPGQFVVDNFTTYNFSTHYDVVYSLGFIEHFTNWIDIIVRHAQIVKPNGWLLIGAPNYAGIVQRVLHKLLEEENYKTHVTASMNPALWKQILEGAGFEVTYAGTVGSFDLWSQGLETLPRITQEFAWMLGAIKKTLAGLEETKSFASSSYLGIVARRKSTASPMSLMEHTEVRASIDRAYSESQAHDQRQEEAAETIVREMRAYFENRSKMSMMFKDVVRRLIGRH